MFNGLSGLRDGSDFPGFKGLSGFKAFLLRGNVVDLAVGIVIGAAFTGVVGAFTNSFVQPLIKVFTGGKDPVEAGAFKINGQAFDWAEFVNAIIAFLITAAVSRKLTTWLRKAP